MGAGASGISAAARKDLAGASAADLEAAAEELSEEDRAKFLAALKADATATAAPPASPKKLMAETVTVFDELRTRAGIAFDATEAAARTALTDLSAEDVKELRDLRKPPRVVHRLLELVYCLLYPQKAAEQRAMNEARKPPGARGLTSPEPMSPAATPKSPARARRGLQAAGLAAVATTRMGGLAGVSAAPVNQLVDWERLQAMLAAETFLPLLASFAKADLDAADADLLADYFRGADGVALDRVMRANKRAGRFFLWAVEIEPPEPELEACQFCAELFADRPAHEIVCPKRPAICVHCADTFTAAEVDAHEATCPMRPVACGFPECTARVPFRELEAHRATCPHRPAEPQPCPYAPCKELILPGWKMERHLKECVYMPVPCKYAKHGCKVMQPRAKLDRHQDKCPCGPQKCKNHADGCPVRLLRAELDDHEKDCSYEMAGCRFHVYGCDARLPRARLAEHEFKCEHGAVRCKYSKKGCDEVLALCDLEKHERNCPYQLEFLAPKPKKCLSATSKPV